MSADITLSQAKRLHAMGAMDRETLAAYITLDHWRRKNRNVIAAQGKRDHLREAAPKMKAALDAVQAGLLDGSIVWAKRRQSDSEPYHPANTLMCQALDAAEGRK